MAKKKVKRTTKKTSKRTTKKTAIKKAEKRPLKKGKVKMGLAVTALLLNFLTIPGLGTIIAGYTRTGIWQIILALIGLALSFIWVGIPILLAAYLWGIVTGILLIQQSKT